MLDLHIKTKTTDTVFHKESLFFYETLFDVFHDAKEAMQDSKQESGIDGKEARAKSYKLLEEAKSILESMVNSNKDIAVDNVLRGLVEKLWFQCGSSRALCDCKDSSELESNQETSESEEPAKSEEEEPESKDDVSSYGMEIEVVPADDSEEDEEDEEDEEESEEDKEKEEEKNSKMW